MSEFSFLGELSFRYDIIFHMPLMRVKGVYLYVNNLTIKNYLSYLTVPHKA